ncbi:MAG: RHS repeat-associated core domain-containing protein [Actinomycetota bacterium]
MGFGPLSVGLSSGALGVGVNSTSVGLVGGSVSVGLGFRSFAAGYVADEPTGTLPAGWSFDGLGRVVPWVSAVQVGLGDVPEALVLTAFDGQQVEFTNTRVGSGAVSGGWAPPVQVGWPSGQFGSLSDDGDVSAAGSKLTWSSGSQVVVFEQLAVVDQRRVWVVTESREVEPGGFSGVSVRAEWELPPVPLPQVPRLKSLVDPASGKSAQFVYSSDSLGRSCDGQAVPVDGGVRYYAPVGLLCGWTNFDGRSSLVRYVKVGASDPGDPTQGWQVGWVVRPGGVNTQYSWTSDGGGSPEQLFRVQAPLGWDAQNTAGLTEEAVSWFVNYEELTGRVESVVSATPGVDQPGVDQDRIARFFDYAPQGAGCSGSCTRVSHGVVDQGDPQGVVTAGAELVTVEWDGAWRPTKYSVPAAGGGRYVSLQSWDTVHDRLLVAEGPNGRVRVSDYDYLGRLVNRWGPAPVSSFTDVGASDGGLVPVVGDDVLIGSVSSFEADGAGLLAGLTVSMYASSTPVGVPASSLGSCAEGQCPDADSPPLTWTALPTTAKVSGGGWSLNAVGSHEAPADANVLRYRVSTDTDAASVRLFASGMCNATVGASDCAPEVAVPSSTLAGEPVTLQVQYTRNATAVSASNPLSVTIEVSTDGGGTWTVLGARDVDPGFGTPSERSQTDTFTEGGPTQKIVNNSIYQDPQRQQVKTQTLDSDGVSVTMDHTFEGYDGSTTWGRPLQSTDYAGTTVAATYWGPTQTPTADPCGAQGSTPQAGLQASSTMSNTGTGDASGMSVAMVYDIAGRTTSQTYTSQDGNASYTRCHVFGARDQPLKVSTLDGSLSTEYAYPWNDPNSTDPYTTTATHTTVDVNRTPQTYSTSSTADLLGRNVVAVDPWGTRTVTNYAVDPTTGVDTITTVTTTAVGFSVTQTAVIGVDGLMASTTRADGTTTVTATYAYNTDSTIDTVTITNGSTEIITETLAYQPTTGSHIGSTWSRGGTVIATDTLTESPNSLRALGETIATGGVTYDWDYTYGGLSRLTGAELSSSDDSISGSWAYGFADQSASVTGGENPNAHLNGNITSKTVSLNGGPSDMFTYHYDFADRLTRTTDPDLAGLVYDSFGNLTTIGADTISYNRVNSPVSVTDGTTTVDYTRLLSYQLIEKTTRTGGVDTTIRYSSNGLMLNTIGQVVTQIFQFGPLIITTPATNTATATTYQLNTLLGNRMLTLDATGTPTKTVPDLFDPYGNPVTTPDVNADDTPDYAWNAATNAETESLELPYVMMGARVYLPQLGRFSSPDPIPGASNSEYTYARSDPINYHDPNGLSPKQWAHGKNGWTNFWHEFGIQVKRHHDTWDLVGFLAVSLIFVFAGVVGGLHLTTANEAAHEAAAAALAAERLGADDLAGLVLNQGGGSGFDQGLVDLFEDDDLNQGLQVGRRYKPMFSLFDELNSDPESVPGDVDLYGYNDGQENTQATEDKVYSAFQQGGKNRTVLYKYNPPKYVYTDWVRVRFRPIPE